MAKTPKSIFISTTLFFTDSPNPIERTETVETLLVGQDMEEALAVQQVHLDQLLPAAPSVTWVQRIRSFFGL